MDTAGVHGGSRQDAPTELDDTLARAFFRPPPRSTSAGSGDETVANARPPAPPLPGAGGSNGARPPPPPIPQDPAGPPAAWLGEEPLQEPRQEPNRQGPAGDSPREENPRQIFEAHWSEQAIQAGLRSGTLVQGVLRASAKRRSVAHVRPDGATAERLPDILIKGKKARNRAIHGDLVVVAELRDEEDPAVQEDESDAESRPAPVQRQLSDSDEEIVLQRPVLDAGDEPSRQSQPRLPQWARGGPDRGSGRRAMGKVVAIVERRGSGRVIVCTLQPNDRTGQPRNDGIVNPDDMFLRAKPIDERFPWILLQINDVIRKVLDIPGRLDKYIMWPIGIITWRETSALPLGRLKGEALGRAGELVAEEKCALIENELTEHDLEFPDSLQDEVDDMVAAAANNFDAEAEKRLDLRSKRIFTIDPSTAKDLDDAIHVDRLPGGEEVEVGVHIADVAHFLRLGMETDAEAQSRTTSVYLVNRVMPMLPFGLCNHLCSLNPKESKLSFSVFFRLNVNTGERCVQPAPWFKKTVMCSCCRLNYDEVQKLLDGKDIRPEDLPAVYGSHTWKQIKDDIFLLYDVCGKVRRGRLEGGALAIQKQKMIFHTRESKDGIPTGYHLEEHSASHWIIEELMLLANRCVAEYLAHSRLSEVSVLRNHDEPDQGKASVLAKMLKDNLGLDWDSRDAASLHRSCRAVYRRYGETLGLCVDLLVMQNGMAQAQYFVYGGEEDAHHYALNFDFYTHFTSPIRRYPDVMVHRVLEALVSERETSEGFHTTEDAKDLVQRCNVKKQATRKCTERLDRAVFCIYLRSRKEWFYSIGTVLEMKPDDNNDGGSLSVFCAQLGRQSKVDLCRGGSGSELPLIQSEVEDEVLLPANWYFRGRGACVLEWLPEDGDRSRRRRQKLQIFSCVPIVIIPTDEVPIDYAVYFVSPFHRRSAGLMEKVPEAAAAGLAWAEVEGDGVQVVHNALTDPEPLVQLDDDGVQLMYDAQAELH